MVASLKRVCENLYKSPRNAKKPTEVQNCALVARLHNLTQFDLSPSILHRYRTKLTRNGLRDLQHQRLTYAHQKTCGSIRAFLVVCTAAEERKEIPKIAVLHPS